MSSMKQSTEAKKQSHTRGRWRAQLWRGGAERVATMRIWAESSLDPDLKTNGRLIVTPIADLNGGIIEVRENANLIAAAPDMLAALKVIQEDWLKTEQPQAGSSNRRLALIAAVIAKAEGRGQ